MSASLLDSSCSSIARIRKGDMAILEQTNRLAFGMFEVDLQAGELWKGGHRIRLAGQPFKVLSVLLARPGEVVSRDELQSKVWGVNTNVDFERAVAGAINKIREALGDSADNPRFIQTLPKRGYRFIAPVSSLQTAVPAPSSSSAVTEPVQEHVAEIPVAVTHPATQSALISDANAQDDMPYTRQAMMVSLQVAVAVLLVSLFIIIFLWKTQGEVGPLRVDQLTHSGTISTGPPNLENLLTLATDGNRVLTSVMEGGRAHLSAISIGTGEVQPLSLPGELGSSLLADISKDGTRLLLKSHLSSASEQPLWIVPSSGGSGLRVGNVLAHDAAWVPNGTSILYASGNDLAIVQLDNGISTSFARLRGRAFWMRWSPDGKLLRFTLQDPVTHSSGIWEMPSGGGTPHPVRTPDAASASSCCGSWTSDGSAYVFVSKDDLWSLSGTYRPSSLSKLTNGPLRFLSPVTAREGSRVFFLGLDQPAGMQVFNDKDGFHRVPGFLANATRVDFSRNGVWVAWTDHDDRLWRAKAADGSDKLQLAPDYMDVFMAHWSPDSSRLAVMAREPGKVWRLYLIDADGGTPESVLNETRNAADPGWSADGQDLVFGREPDPMGKEGGSHTIEIVHLATRTTESVPSSEGMFSPRWSPDGKWIAALSLNQKSVWIYDVAKQRWKELAQTSAADPIWTSDSKALYVHAFLAEKQPLLRIGVPNGDLHTVTDLSGFNDRATINYFFGGLTPVNEPMVQPHVGTGDLYTLDLKTR